MAGFADTAFDEVNAFDPNAFDFDSAAVNTTKPGWYSLHDVFHEAEFMALMRTEAQGAGNWAYWAAGVDLPDPIPRLSGNLELNYPHFRTAATGATAWARFAPGTTSNVRGDIQVDLQAAELANFVL